MAVSFKKLLERDDVKEYSELKGPIAVLALHGGNLEAGTEQIVRSIGENSNASIYIISVRSEESFNKLHVPSTKINPVYSEKLHKIVENCTTAIAIHGHSRKKYDDTVFVSGSNEKLHKVVSESLKINLDNYKFRTTASTIPDDLNCDDPRNILNKFELKGVQIELPISLRQVIEEQGADNYKSTNLYGDTKTFVKVLIKILEN